MRRWRLFEEKDGKLFTLFHGVDGSRQIEEGVTYKASNRLVRDGTSKTWYHGGFHVFRNNAPISSYILRFTAPRRLVLVNVKVTGCKEKPTNENILLAQTMCVPKNAIRVVVKEGNDE